MINDKKMNLSWDVVYAPGELKAIARTAGNVVAEKVIKTASAPAKIEIIADKNREIAGLDRLNKFLNEI